MRSSSLSLTVDDKGFVFDTGHTFRGLTISECMSGYNVIIRALNKHGAPVYAMTTADDPGDGIFDLMSALTASSGASLWRPDKYAAKRRVD